ncbi:threonine synthase [Aquimarina sp. AU58]|uniref:threonine synthase n=1 Tax=Aquimarina sp. AU58 TaxID=1874112 RepID=UPI000D6E76C3|nr:threonine synthase [Aquimarina sp. AU58]
MIQYVSNKGNGASVDFETAILAGRAPDGGLYVPTSLPRISKTQLQSWKNLSYTDLAFEVLSLFIDETTISSIELHKIIENSFDTFYHPEKIPFHSLTSRKNIIIQELFHGPTLSFKDIAMGFVVNLLDFFLKRRKEKMSIMVATSGDTGPAAAFATIGKETINTWALYPQGYITEEQERQMTTITAPNVHSVRVTNCPNGSDDLDELISSLFANTSFKQELNLSSVNSINWGRIMMQTVHYFYGYLKTVDTIGELLNFAVPSGAFGNLCAGSLAREMGLPVGKFILSNNQNNCLQRIFNEGIYVKEKVINCASSAIDISLPINFWRYLYFAIDQNPEKIKLWMEESEKNNRVEFDKNTHKQFSKGFLTASISDKLTLNTIQEVFETEGYLLDPHAAVAVAAANTVKAEFPNDSKILCLATAHPSKFSDVIKESLNVNALPAEAIHHSIENAKEYCQKIYECNYENMYQTIPKTMQVISNK